MLGCEGEGLFEKRKGEARAKVGKVLYGSSRQKH